MADIENNPVQEKAALAVKKHRTIVIWLRVTAVLFLGVFLLSKCGMSKPQAKAAIIDSCVKNIPFSPRWSQALGQRGLSDPNGALVQQYCVCMWDEPLQKLSHKQIQSFSSIGSQEQLKLLGGEQAFAQRDAQCMAALSAP